MRPDQRIEIFTLESPGEWDAIPLPERAQRVGRVSDDERVEREPAFGAVRQSCSFVSRLTLSMRCDGRMS
jgi:hypothetical protein